LLIRADGSSDDAAKSEPSDFRANLEARAHVRIRSVRSIEICPVVSRAADARAITMRSTGCSSSLRDRRNHSRTPLFTRFLVTAFPTRRLTVTPNLRHSPDTSSRGEAIKTTKFRDARRFPPRPTRWKSRESRIRSVRRKRPVFPDIGYFEALATARRFRPFARRRFKTARPPCELIRARNPWFLCRRIRLG
jgi:hypothetical protein